MINKKVCTKCKVEKELSEFNKKLGGKFGVDSVCRLCQKNYMKEYSKKNKKIIDEYSKGEKGLTVTPKEYNKLKESLPYKSKQDKVLDGDYNRGHSRDKNMDRLNVFNAVSRDYKIETVLDLYASNISCWKAFKNPELYKEVLGERYYEYSMSKYINSKEYTVISNDVKKYPNNTYSKEASFLARYLYNQNQKFDLIECDPFGDCYEELPWVISMAKKVLILSFGYSNGRASLPILNKRFGLEIKNKDNLVNEISDYVIDLGKVIGKNIELFHSKYYESSTFIRMYFIIKE